MRQKDAAGCWWPPRRTGGFVPGHSIPKDIRHPLTLSDPAVLSVTLLPSLRDSSAPVPSCFSHLSLGWFSSVHPLNVRVPQCSPWDPLLLPVYILLPISPGAGIPTSGPACPSLPPVLQTPVCTCLWMPLPGRPPRPQTNEPIWNHRLPPCSCSSPFSLISTSGLFPLPAT